MCFTEVFFPLEQCPRAGVLPQYSWSSAIIFRINNNNIYVLQLGYHPVAVVILHVHKYEKVTSKFKSGGLHERHVVATWKLGNHLSIRL